MNGETNLAALLQYMKPELQEGDYVFCTVKTFPAIDTADLIGFFREQEGLTIIVAKSLADQYQLPYSSIFSWITLTVHSSLLATGLTAAFSTALAGAGISCNVVAAFYHDHIFTAKADALKAMEILFKLAAA